jgi:uncharacterized protein YegP (UPF0339 family)
MKFTKHAPCFELKQAKNDQFYFVLKAGNGQTIAISEMYESKQSAQEGIESVKINAGIAETNDMVENIKDSD